jgi:cobalt-zinc-cadmium efflux system protein
MDRHGVGATRAVSNLYTYGLGSGTIPAALTNAVLLLVAFGAIAVEGVRRLIAPSEIASTTALTR